MMRQLLDRIAYHARTRPNDVAIEALGNDGSVDELSFRELEQRAGRTAIVLQDSGVRAGSPVKVAMARSPHLVVALLGIWKTGGHYVPVPADASSRAQRISSMYPDALTVTDPLQGEVLPRLMRPADSGDGMHPDGIRNSDEKNDPRLAYVMFTSGSTGAPKGVALPSDAVERLVLDEGWDDGRHLRLGMLAPHAFQLSTYEIWVPLARGGTVVMAPDGPLDFEVVATIAQRVQQQSLHVTAGLFRAIATDRPQILEGVLEIATGGDVVSPSAVRAVLEHCPDTVVRPIYGCTEGVLFSTQQRYRAVEDVDVLPLGGRPFAGASITIVDHDFRELPPGEVGEICIGGDRLALGYIGNPELTAERFIHRRKPPYDRLYRTGDIGRIDASGDLVLLGRTDRQVKIRGFRVELAEVEQALMTLPGVKDAAVRAVDAATDHTKLLAFVTGDVSGARSLRRAAREVVPDYMIPQEVKVMNQLPLTRNGKIDWLALEESATEGHSVTEEDVTATFASVLETDEPVGPEDDFFDLGGQSITAMRLAAALSEVTGQEISAREVLDAPSPRQLHTTIQNRK